MNQATRNDAVVRYLSLVRKEGGEPIVGIPYREMSVDPDLVASFVLAVIIFENRQLKTFTKEGYVVVIEEGDYVVGLLIIDRVEDDTPFRNALKNIITLFEEKYEIALNNWKGDIRPFREFALDILGVYPYKEIDWELIPRLLPSSDAAPDQRVEIPWSVGETDEKIHTIIGFINGKRTILEIMDASAFTESDTMAIMSMLDRYNWIAFTRKLREDTILVKKIEPPKYLVGVYGEQLTQLVSLCDGTRTLQQICEQLPYNIEAVKTVAKNLVDAGILAHNE